MLQQNPQGTRFQFHAVVLQNTPYIFSLLSQFCLGKGQQNELDQPHCSQESSCKGGQCGRKSHLDERNCLKIPTACFSVGKDSLRATFPSPSYGRHGLLNSMTSVQLSLTPCTQAPRTCSREGWQIKGRGIFLLFVLWKGNLCQESRLDWNKNSTNELPQKLNYSITK